MKPTEIQADYSMLNSTQTWANWIIDYMQFSVNINTANIFHQLPQMIFLGQKRLSKLVLPNGTRYAWRTFGLIFRSDFLKVIIMKCVATIKNSNRRWNRWLLYRSFWWEYKIPSAYQALVTSWFRLFINACKNFKWSMLVIHQIRRSTYRLFPSVSEHWIYKRKVKST